MISSPVLLGGGFINLRYLRTLRGITQKEVSQAIGCSEVVYSRYETGAREPSIDTLIKLADFFEVTTDFLLGHGVEVSELLSEHEVRFIRAFRSADQRAREDALALLISHDQSEKEKPLRGSEGDPTE